MTAQSAVKERTRRLAGAWPGRADAPPTWPAERLRLLDQAQELLLALADLFSDETPENVDERDLRHLHAAVAKTAALGSTLRRSFQRCCWSPGEGAHPSQHLNHGSALRGWVSTDSRLLMLFSIFCVYITAYGMCVQAE